ncbi:MAG TPA: hypothetical protein VMI56_17195 [Reyranella sp.]|nr:hypothetical protein [Reyranella sp.]
MAQYTYAFTRVDQELSATVEVDTPIPHLEVGNSVVISNKHLALRGGHHFIIRHVETFIEAINPPRANVHHVTVHIEEVDRANSPVARH